VVEVRIAKANFNTEKGRANVKTQKIESKLLSKNIAWPNRPNIMSLIWVNTSHGQNYIKINVLPQS
jgi:hypothetical protein